MTLLPRHAKAHFAARGWNTTLLGKGPNCLRTGFAGKTIRALWSWATLQFLVLGENENQQSATNALLGVGAFRCLSNLGATTYSITAAICTVWPCYKSREVSQNDVSLVCVVRHVARGHPSQLQVIRPKFPDLKHCDPATSARISATYMVGREALRNASCSGWRSRENLRILPSPPCVAQHPSLRQRVHEHRQQSIQLFSRAAFLCVFCGLFPQPPPFRICLRATVASDQRPLCSDFVAPHVLPDILTPHQLQT